jgi:mercuric ion binding protein
MKFRVAALALLVSLGSGPAQATERTVTLAVDSMTCASCPFIVKRTLAGVSGVRRADVSFKTKTAAVVFDDAVTSTGAMTEATAKAGFPSKVTQ